MNLRSILLASALAALAACSHAPPPPPAPAAPRAQFTPYPASAIAGWKDPHVFRDRKPLCQACHTPETGALLADPVALCQRCHAFHHSNHPVNVVQKADDGGLPLAAGRKVACHTCHDPHDVKARRAGLRVDYGALCLQCHSRHAQRPAAKH